MKTFLVVALLPLLCSGVVLGQKVDTKSRINAFHNQTNPEYFHNLSNKVKKYELQHPSLKSSKGNQFKPVLTSIQLLDSTIFETWDTTASQLIVNAKSYTTYDFNEIQSTEIFFYWEKSTNQWLADLKKVITYDANGNVTQNILYEFDVDNYQWVLYQKQQYAYDDLGNVISEILYNSNNQITYGSKYNNKYDDNGNVTQDSVSLWDPTGRFWVPGGKDEYSYDAGGNLASLIFSYWNDSTSQFVLNYKGEFNYDANGYDTLDIYSNWYAVTSEWIIEHKTENTFDDAGNLTSLVDYFWTEATSKRENSYKYENTYDVNGNLTGSIYFQWDETSSQWLIIDKRTYYYSEYNITAVPVIPERKISVYPNPASDHIVFDLTHASESANVELFDLQGKKVLEQKLSESKQISVNNLRKGLYMYRLNNNGTIYEGKITVE